MKMFEINLLTVIIIYIVFLSFSKLSLVMFSNKYGKKISFASNLLGVVFIFGVFFLGDALGLGEMIYLSKAKIKVLLFLAFANFIIILLNGFKKTSDIISSILVGYVFLGSVLFLGARNFIGLFVGLEFIALIALVLLGTENFSIDPKKIVRHFLRSATVSVFFILGISFFLVGTGGLDFLNLQVKNNHFYLLSIIIFLAVTFYRIGVVPLHLLYIDIYSNCKRGNLVAYLFIIRPVITFGMVTLLQKLVLRCPDIFQTHIIAFVLAIAVLSVFWGNIIIWANDEIKKMVAYLSMAHTAQALVAICTKNLDGLEKELIFYLFFGGISSLGVLLIINEFLENKSKDQQVPIMNQQLPRGDLRALILSFFILSLIGLPFTSGFTSRYLVFTIYFREGFFLTPSLMLITSALGLVCFLKVIMNIFMSEDGNLMARRQGKYIYFSVNFIIYVFLAFLIFMGGLRPFYFLK